MDETLNFEQLAKEILLILREHKLFPDAFGVVLTIPREHFESVAADHPGHHPEMISVGMESENVQWFVQIQPRRKPEDFPPGAILTPSSD